MMTDQTKFENATMVSHCAVTGRSETPVRHCSVSAIAPYAQHAKVMQFSFLGPRKRTSFAVYAMPDNIRYITIEQGGNVLYDSRADVPCDMGEWNKTAERFAARKSLEQKMRGA